MFSARDASGYRSLITVGKSDLRRNQIPRGPGCMKDFEGSLNRIVTASHEYNPYTGLDSKMDDGIELNFAPAAGSGSDVTRQSAASKRGGRWTER